MVPPSSRSFVEVDQVTLNLSSANQQEDVTVDSRGNHPEDDESTSDRMEPQDSSGQAPVDAWPITTHSYSIRAREEQGNETGA